MKGHHEDYHKWVEESLEAATSAKFSLTPEQALKNVQSILVKLKSIISKHPDVLTHGPKILPPHLQNLTPSLS